MNLLNQPKQKKTNEKTFRKGWAAYDILLHRLETAVIWKLKICEFLLLYFNAFLVDTSFENHIEVEAPVVVVFL